MNRNDELQHYGVKGMRWGVRNSTRASQGRYKSYGKGLKLIDKSRLKKMSSAKERETYLNAKDKKWIEKASNDANVRKVATRTASQMKRVNKQLQKEHGGSGIKGSYKRAVSGKLNREYQKALKEAYDEVLLDNAYSVFKISPSRTREVEITALPDGRLKATVVQRNNLKLTKQRAQINKAVERRERKEAKLAKRNLQQSEFDTDPFSKLDGMSFIITTDENGYADDVTTPFDDILQSLDGLLNIQEGDDTMKHELDELTDDLLKHYGVKGMKWGVRNNNNESSSQDAAGGGGGGEEEEDGLFEDMMEELDDLTGAAKAKLSEVSKDLKKMGRGLVHRLFGKPAVFGQMQKSSVQSMFSKNQLTVYKDLETGFTVKRRTPNESNSFKSVAKEQISNSKTAARKDRERASNRKKAKELVRNRY